MDVTVMGSGVDEIPEAPLSESEEIAAVVDILQGKAPEKKEEKPEKAIDTSLDQKGIEDTEATGDGVAKVGDKTSDEDDDEDLGFSMQDLADEAGLDIKELYDTEIKFGEGRDPTTLGKLKDFYDKNRDGPGRVQEKLKALDDMKHEGEAATAARAEYQPQVTAAETRIRELQGKWDAVDWEHIPEGRQGEYEQYARDLQAGFQRAKLSHENAQAAMQDTTAQMARIQAGEEQAKQDVWKQEAAKQWPLILADHPDWKGHDEAKAGMDELYGVMVDYGMTEMEARQTTDSRVFKMAADALRYKQAGKVNLKEVRKAGKHVGGRKPVPEGVRSKRAKIRALNAARDGTEADQIAAVSALIS